MKKIYMLVLIFSVASIERSHAIVKGNFTLTITTGNYFYVDHNNCSSGGGPRAAYLGTKIMNVSGISQNNIVLEFVKYTDDVHYMLAGGQASSQSLATMANNANDTLFWYSTYPCFSSGTGFPTGVIFRIKDLDDGTSYLDTLNGLLTEEQISSNGGGLVGTSQVSRVEPVGGLFCFRCDYEYPKMVSGDKTYMQPTTSLSFDAASFQLESAVILSSTANSAGCIPVGNCPLNYTISGTCNAFDISLEYCFRIKADQSTFANPYNSATSGEVGLKYVVTEVPVNLSPAVTLPVELTYFNGQAVGNEVLLTWNTVSEINSAFFDIQRSVDGVNFYSVHILEAAHFSNSSIDYSYTDKSPVARGYYRLRMIDMDGSERFSDIKLVKLSDRTTYLKMNLYPNPVSDNICLELASKPENASCQIFALNGELINEFKINPEGGQKIFLDISGYGSGYYRLRYTDQNGTISRSFIKK